MGKASSSKKVARAARAGGRVSSGQPRSLLFPGVLALIVVLGIGLVIYARNDRLDDDLGGVPQLGDHIHQAFSVSICGEPQAAIPEFESDVGIHTHGDGLIHIHPFSQLGVGANATLGRFFEDARDQGGLEVELSDSRIEYLGTVAEEGETECEGVDDPVLRMGYWADVEDAEADPEVTTGGFADTRLTENGAGITIYYGDPDDDIPPPEAGAQLTELGLADGGSTLEDPETGATTTSTTAAVDSTATTTAAGETTTSTTAPG
jgi:hypothetical protein